MNLKTQPLHPKTRQMNTQDKQNLYIYKSRSLNQVLPRQVKNLSKKLTRIKFKLKKPQGAFRDIPLQTTRAYQLKKKKKKKERNAVLYKNKQPFIQGTKETQKKKKKKSKNPKTQNVFPDQNSYSLRLQTLSIKGKKKPIKIHLRLAILPQKKNAADKERVLRSFARLRAPLQAERKIYGHQHRQLYICHHQIVGTGTGTFSPFFLDLGMKYYFLVSFFLLDRF